MSINPTFFLEVVIPRLLMSTLFSLTMALVAGGIIGSLAAKVFHKRFSSTIQAAIAGAFIGSMLITWLPIFANPASMNSSPYTGIWMIFMLMFLLPIGAIGGAIAGILSRRFIPRNYQRQSMLWVGMSTYLISAVTIYATLVPAPLQISQPATTAAQLPNAFPVMAEIRGYTGVPNDLAFDAAGTQLAVATPQGIQVWDLQAKKQVQTIKAPTPSQATLKTIVSKIQFSTDGTQLFGIGLQGIQIFSIQSGQVTRTIAAGNYALSTPDGQHLVTLEGETDSPYSKVLVWDTKTYQQRYQIPANIIKIEEVPITISADSKQLAIAPKEYQNAIEIWDVQTGKKLVKFGGDRNSKVTAMAFTPNGKQLAVGDEGILYLWDIAQKKVIRTLAHSGPAVQNMRFTPDGKTLLMVSEDRLDFWDVGSGQIRKTVKSTELGFWKPVLRADTSAIAFYATDKIQVWALSP